jgi:DNA-binding transcriptional ArsR family regulator
MQKANSPSTTMKQFVTITNALADESRLRSLMALKEGELCACQIIDLLGLAPSTVSRHLSILKQANLVESRKDGKWMYYRLAIEDSAATVDWIHTAIGRNETILADKNALSVIKKNLPETLCKKQHTRT